MPEITRDTLIDRRYKVIGRLGTGGMADVFGATDQQLGRKVAVKLLHRRFAEDPAFVERFRREAQSAAGLQHQNIVSVYDRGEFDGTYYIAMEYLPGRSLKQLIRDEAPLEPVRAIEIAIQILRAARFAHRRGIIHRDLKPHNVIVDDSGHATVTDFGIARAGASDMTETGSIMGTAQYLSPEQAQGHAVQETSDLYAIGVVLYEMLTGRVPFDGESPVTIALKHVSEPPVPPSRFNSAVTPELEQTVLWTLNKHAADRPRDADQLMTVLEHCKEAIVTGQAGQSTASMAALAGAGNPLAPALPLPSLPEAPVTPGVDTNGSGSLPAVGGDGEGSDDDGDAGPPARRRWLPWLLAVLVLLLIAGAAAAAYFLSRPKHRLVPRTVGLQYAVAASEVRHAGFTVSSVPLPSVHDKGIVIGSEPGGGTKAVKGSNVTLTVSRGPTRPTIPSVAGETKRAAQRKLIKAGLTIAGTQARSSATVPDGRVVATSPAAGTTVEFHAPVTLYISSGKPTAAVPPVVGETEAEARSKLDAAGFAVGVETRQSTTVTAGNVIGQDPGANTVQLVGSTVTLTVAKAPPTVQVPNVVGDNLDQAVAALQADGFQVVRQTTSVRNPANAGIIQRQSPAGNSQQPKGSSVTIVIGDYDGSTTSTTTTSPSSSSSSTTTSQTRTSASSTSPTTPASH